MRIKHKVNPRIWDDTTQKDCLFGLDDALSEVTIDNMQRYASGRFNLAVAGLGPVPEVEALSFGDVDVVKGIFIKADRALGLNLDALGERTLEPAGTGKPVKMLWEGPVSSASVINNDLTNEVNGIYLVWGDPAP